MDEDFKKWLCNLLGIHYRTIDDGYGDIYGIEILIKAMWKINKRPLDFNMIEIRMDAISITLWKRGDGVPFSEDFYDYEYVFKDYNNSELEALTKALEYIWENTK